MATYLEILKKGLKNKVLHYVFSRYATYIIQFINSLFIAHLLGPYYLGIWGFITLIIQYLNQINLGISHSVNVIISIHKKKQWYVQKVVGTSITMLIGFSVAVALFFVANELFSFNIGSKYNFSVYAPIVVLIGILGYFNTLMSAVFRAYGKVIEVAVNQSAFPFLMLFAIIFFRGENLLWALVGANFLAFFISFILYNLKSPLGLKPILIKRLAKTIQIKGWHLFVYNTSFHLIVISTRSFISAYYPVEEFGYFTFAYSLSNVVLLLLQSLSFLITPKIINRMASVSSEKIISVLNTIRVAYITTSHLLIHTIIFLFPLLLLFFPKYQQSSDAFKLIALTVVLYTNSFGYSGLLIAQGKERQLGRLSLFILIMNILVVYLLIVVIQVTFSKVIIATMLSYIFYVFYLTSIGRKFLKQKACFIAVFKDIYPLKLTLPYLLSLGLVFITAPGYLFIFPLLLFLVLNFHDLFQIKKTILSVITNPKVIDI